MILQQVFSTPAKELANRWILVAIWISKTHPLFARLLCELRSVQVDNRENKLVKTMSKQDHALLTNTVKKKNKTNTPSNHFHHFPTHLSFLHRFVRQGSAVDRSPQTDRSSRRTVVPRRATSAGLRDSRFRRVGLAFASTCKSLAVTFPYTFELYELDENTIFVVKKMNENSGCDFELQKLLGRCPMRGKLHGTTWDLPQNL